MITIYLDFTGIYVFFVCHGGSPSHHGCFNAKMIWWLGGIGVPLWVEKTSGDSMYIVGCSSSRQMVDSTSAKLKDVKMSEVYEGLIFIEHKHKLFYMPKHQLFYMPNWIDVDLFWMCVFRAIKLQVFACSMHLDVYNIHLYMVFLE
jgi:hypothetical protein